MRGPGDAHRLIAAWAEEVRYGAARNGYHGGATPQEMVAPLVAPGRRDRPPARAGAVRAPPAGLVGRAGRPATGRDRGHGRPPAAARCPGRPPDTCSRWSRAGRGRGPVHAPAAASPSRSPGAGRPGLAATPDRVAGLPGPAADGPQVRPRGRGRRAGPGGPGPPGRRDHARRAGPPGRRSPAAPARRPHRQAPAAAQRGRLRRPPARPPSATCVELDVALLQRQFDLE